MSSEDVFEKLEQLVFDENKLVTYKSLSIVLNIHVNEAKQYLHDFYSKKLKEKQALYAKFIIAGFHQPSQTVKVMIDSDKNVENTKKLFSEVTSCHIYAVSRGNQIDECMLYTSDLPYLKNSDVPKLSGIKYLNLKFQPPVLNRVPVAANPNAKSNITKKEEKPKSNGVASMFQSKTTDTNKKVAKTPSKDKENGVASSIFSSTDNKKESPEKSKAEVSKPEAKVNKKTPPVSNKKSSKSPGQNSLLSMFSKQAEKNKESEKLPAREPPKPVKVESPRQVEFPAPKKDTKSQKNKPAKRSTSKRSKHTKGSDSDEELKPQKKKHKRIAVFEESDSESECEEEQDKAQRDMEEPLPKVAIIDEDEEDVIPPTPHQGRKRVWKTVTKTFEDEDGFFVTKREKQLVSESESDSEKPPKDSKTEKASKNEENIKNTLTTHKKQASLSSFFKQK